MTKPNNHLYYNNFSPEIHKIGVSNINEVADSIYDYQSPLLKEQTNSTETVLQILYKYRKNSFQEVVLVLLEHLTKAILSDKTGEVLDSLLLADGPAYTCRRYWDWIQPFITQLITDSY
jgi:3-dehydroquinate synthetase